MSSKTFFLFFIISLFSTQLLAQQGKYHKETVLFEERNLSGPRLGITMIPGDGKLVSKLDNIGVGRTISQFGWHFEWQVIPKGGGPQFVVELVPMLGGVEYGTIIPSATLAMGVRLPNGIEFGMGPNLLFGSEDVVHSSLILAVGKSFDYSGVSIPINLAYATNPEGDRISIVFGYAISN